MKQKKIVSGYFTDDKDLIVAIKKLQARNIAIADVRTPFPVHGLDTVLKFKRSRLPRAGFIAGVIGLCVGLGFQAWVFTKAWPLNFGGKPNFSLPSFIPVTFELTVLFTAFALVFGFLIRSKLGPGSDAVLYDEAVTDDHFQILLDVKDSNEETMLQTLTEVGAKGIQTHEV